MGKPESSDILLAKEEIMADMWKFFSKDLQRGVVGGLPEWYKTRLAHQQFERDGIPIPEEPKPCEHDWLELHSFALCHKCKTRQEFEEDEL